MIVRTTLTILLTLVCTVCCRPQVVPAPHYLQETEVQPKLDRNDVENNPHLKKLFQEFLADYIEKQNVQTTARTSITEASEAVSFFPSKTTQQQFPDVRHSQPKRKRIRHQHQHESTTPPTNQPEFSYVYTPQQTLMTSQQPEYQSTTNPHVQKRIFVGTIVSGDNKPSTSQLRRKSRPSHHTTTSTSPLYRVDAIRNRQENEFSYQPTQSTIAPAQRLLLRTQFASTAQIPQELFSVHPFEPVFKSSTTSKLPQSVETASKFDEETLNKYAPDNAINNPFVASEINLKNPSSRADQEVTRTYTSKSVLVPQTRKTASQFEDKELKSMRVSQTPSKIDQEGTSEHTSKTVSPSLVEKEFRRQAETAKYEFASAIDDSFNGNQQLKEEVRDGLAVKGKYSFSDGYYKRTVHYEADDKGYRVVKQEVEPLLEGPQINLNGHAKVSTYIDGNNVVNYQIGKDDIQPRIKTVAEELPSFERDDDNDNNR